MTRATWYPPERPGQPQPPWRPDQPGPTAPPDWRQPGWQPDQPVRMPNPPATFITPPMEDPRRLWDERLLDQRIVMVTGRLGSERATETSAKLLLLDARSQEPVTLRIDSPDADLNAVWTLVDTLDAMVVPVRALVVGEIGGGSMALLTAAKERFAHPHARFRLSDPILPMISGHAERLAAESAATQTLLDAFHDRLALLTNQPLELVVDDLAHGRFLTTPQAIDYGLVTAARPAAADPM